MFKLYRYISPDLKVFVLKVANNRALYLDKTISLSVIASVFRVSNSVIRVALTPGTISTVIVLRKIQELDTNTEYIRIINILDCLIGRRHCGTSSSSSSDDISLSSSSSAPEEGALSDISSLSSQSTDLSSQSSQSLSSQSTDISSLSSLSTDISSLSSQSTDISSLSSLSSLSLSTSSSSGVGADDNSSSSSVNDPLDIYSDLGSAPPVLDNPSSIAITLLSDPGPGDTHTVTYTYPGSLTSPTPASMTFNTSDWSTPQTMLFTPTVPGLVTITYTVTSTTRPGTRNGSIQFTV